MPTFSSLVATVVVVTTTSCATSEDKVGIMTTFGFQLIMLDIKKKHRQYPHTQNNAVSLTYLMLPGGTRPLTEQIS